MARGRLQMSCWNWRFGPQMQARAGPRNGPNHPLSATHMDPVSYIDKPGVPNSTTTPVSRTTGDPQSGGASACDYGALNEHWPVMTGPLESCAQDGGQILVPSISSGTPSAGAHADEVILQCAD